MISTQIEHILYKTIDFFKKNYEYLIPFALIYLILCIPGQFLPQGISACIQLIMLPLSFSFAYFVDRVEKGYDRKFSDFFDIYRHTGKYLAIIILRALITIVLFTPFIIVAFRVISEYNFDVKAIEEAMKSQNFNITSNEKLSLAISFLLVIFTTPFLLFNEYFAILDKYSISDSFRFSFEAGKKHYGLIFASIILSIGIGMIGLVACCIGVVLISMPLIYPMFYYTYRQINPIVEHPEVQQIMGDLQP